MKQFNMDSYITAVDNDKDLEIRKNIKRRRITIKSNKKSFNYDLYISLIDSKNIDEIEKFNSLNEKNKIDIIFEFYKNKLLTTERLQFIMKNCTKYWNISSKLVKKLFKDKNASLLDIIFSYIKFFDNEIILKLLLLYNNKTAIFTSDLNQLISSEKFKILINTDNIKCIKTYYLNHSDKNVYKYLINECKKRIIN